MSCKHEGGTDPCERNACGQCKVQRTAYRHRPEYKEREKARNKVRKRTPEYRAKQRAAYQRSGGRRRWQFGIDGEDFALWLQAQGNQCRICQAEFTGRACIDHCHGSGRLRGILCHACNSMLGYAKDNPDILRAGAAYLERTATAKRSTQ